MSSEYNFQFLNENKVLLYKTYGEFFDRDPLHDFLPVLFWERIYNIEIEHYNVDNNKYRVTTYHRYETEIDSSILFSLVGMVGMLHNNFSDECNPNDKSNQTDQDISKDFERWDWNYYWKKLCSHDTWNEKYSRDEFLNINYKIDLCERNRKLFTLPQIDFDKEIKDGEINLRVFDVKDEKGLVIGFDTNIEIHEFENHHDVEKFVFDYVMLN